MSSKIRSFMFSCYAQRRTHFDDATVSPGDFREPDAWTEFRGVVLVPADKEWGEGQEPDWDQGGFLIEKKTLRRLTGWNFAGRPPEFLIEGWRQGRLIDGVVICGDVKRHRR
jgi:hypothetical protein